MLLYITLCHVIIMNYDYDIQFTYINLHYIALYLCTYIIVRLVYVRRVSFVVSLGTLAVWLIAQGFVCAGGPAWCRDKWGLSPWWFWAPWCKKALAPGLCTRSFSLRHKGCLRANPGGIAQLATPLSAAGGRGQERGGSETVARNRARTLTLVVTGLGTAARIRARIPMPMRNGSGGWSRYGGYL